MTIRNVNYESRDRVYQDRPTLVINDQTAVTIAIKVYLI